MTIAEALAVGIMRLRSPAACAEVRDSARLDAQRLLCEVLEVDNAWVLAHGSEELDSDLLDVFGLLLDERMRGVPVPYLTHKAGFYGREFYVDERVLVPRPESEHVVEIAVARMTARGTTPVRVLDVGTGSGALAVTLAAEMPYARVTATDVSAGALEVARRNARAHGVDERIAFAELDAAEIPQGAPFDCVVANLPYVPVNDIPDPPNPVAFEPRVALDGGADGLAVYRRLIPRLGNLLVKNGVVIMEAAPPTTETLAGLVREAYPETPIAVESDYAGQERLVVASFRAPAVA